MTKNSSNTSAQAEMWINPNSTFKGARSSENRAGSSFSNSRYLDLADIALGVKKSAGKKKEAGSARVRSSGKT
jgi:hypothetical protein